MKSKTDICKANLISATNDQVANERLWRVAQSTIYVSIEQIVGSNAFCFFHSTRECHTNPHSQALGSLTALSHPSLSHPPPSPLSKPSPQPSPPPYLPPPYPIIQIPCTQHQITHKYYITQPVIWMQKVRSPAVPLGPSPGNAERVPMRLTLQRE